MSVERRLRETLAAFDAVEPAPDLFRRVERSVAEDLVRRRRIGRWVAAVVGSVSLGVLVVAGFTRLSAAGTLVVTTWPLVAVETVLLGGLVVAFGPLIRRFGAVFVDDVFGDSTEDVGMVFLRLIDVAYYLVFAGYVILTTPVSDVDGVRALGAMLEVTVERFGGLLLLMGVMHAATITVLPLIGLIHASTVREQCRAALTSPQTPSAEAAFAERVVRIVLWTAGGLAALVAAATLLDIVAGILLGFGG